MTKLTLYATQPGQSPHNQPCSSHIDTCTKKASAQPVLLSHTYTVTTLSTQWLLLCTCNTLIWWQKNHTGNTGSHHTTRATAFTLTGKLHTVRAATMHPNAPQQNWRLDKILRQTRIHKIYWIIFSSNKHHTRKCISNWKLVVSTKS